MPLIVVICDDGAADRQKAAFQAVPDPVPIQFSIGFLRNLLYICSNNMRIFKDFVLGQYYPGQTWIHRLDPRAKLFFVILVMVSLFAGTRWIDLIVWTTFYIMAYSCSRVPLSVVAGSVRPFFWILALTFFLQFFLPGKGELLTIEARIVQAAFYTIRLTLFILYSSLLTLVTSPLEIADALETLLKPLKRLRVPVHDLAMMVSIAIRFIPTIIEEAERIRKAQQVRGVSYRGSLPRRIRALIPLVIPLFMSTMQRAEELAVSMEARCYDRQARRTMYHRLAWRWQETAIAILGLGVLIILKTM